MRVRVATSLDEAAALDVVRTAGHATGRQPSKAVLAALRARLRAATTLTLVADDDDAVVGLLVAELAGAELRLTLLCVGPDRRRQGTGRALVAALLERYPQVVVATDDQVVQELVDDVTSHRGPDLR